MAFKALILVQQFVSPIGGRVCWGHTLLQLNIELDVVAECLKVYTFSFYDSFASPNHMLAAVS